MLYSTKIDDLKLTVQTDGDVSYLSLLNTITQNEVRVYGEQVGLIKLIRRGLSDIQSGADAP